MAFTGEVAELLIGTGGLTGTKNQATVLPDQLLEALNITYENGTIQKEGGSAKYSSEISGTPTIIGGHDWHPSLAVQRRIILGSDGILYKDTGDGAFSVQLKTGLSVSGVNPVFVDGGQEQGAAVKHLFLFTGKNAVQVLDDDGATTGDISDPPTDWSGSNQPYFGVVHEGRLWGGGNLNDPHRIYASLPTDHEDFTSTPFTLDVSPGVGERLIAGASFKGFLVLWKYPHGIFLVDTSSADTANWRVTTHSEEIGGVSPNCWTGIDDDIVFMDHTSAIHVLSAIQEFGNLGSRNISTVSQFDVISREILDLGELLDTQCVYYIAKRQVHFTCSTSSDAYDRRIVLDLNRPDLGRFSISDKDVNASIWLVQDSNGIERPYIGDKSGFVWELDQANRSTGTGYNGQFQTPHLDFSHLDPALGTIEKNGKFLELVVEPKGNWSLSVDILWDDVIHQTLDFNLGTTGSSLGSFVLNTDKLAGSNLLNKKKVISGSGRRFSIICRNSGDGQDFSIAKFYLGFTRGNNLAST